MEKIAQSATPQHSIKSKADTVRPLVYMPDIHLLNIILSNFQLLSCLFYWCDSFETLHGYYSYNKQPIVSISLFMKMKPEYQFNHFKRISNQLCCDVVNLRVNCLCLILQITKMLPGSFLNVSRSLHLLINHVFHSS